MITRASGVVVALAIVAGCDAGDGADRGAPRDAFGDADVAADAVDATDAIDAADGADGDVHSDPEVVGRERVVSSDGAHDDLAPDLSGDDLVWMRIRLDPAVAAVTPDTDCVSCPYCNGCTFSAIYRRLPGGDERVLDEGRQPRAAPRVGDGVAVWLDDAGHAAFREVGAALGPVVKLPEWVWIAPTPVPAAGALWWWGYDSTVSRYALMRYDRASGAITPHDLGANLASGLSPPSTQLYSLVARPPFTLAEDGVLFVPDSGAGLVRRWRWDGSVETVDFGPDLRPRAAEAIDGAVMSLAYPTRCSPCALALAIVDRDGPAPRAPDAAPSIHVNPVGDGERFVWVDHRDGPYTIMAAAADGDEVRVSSDAAVIGALSPIAASAGRVAWADRRDGRMRIMLGATR